MVTPRWDEGPPTTADPNPHEPRRIPHLAAALAATVLLAGGWAGGSFYAGSLIKRDITAFILEDFPQKSHGIVLQREAFRHSDLLPVYGSSELIHPIDNWAIQFFHRYPTGFAVFPLADLGEPPLVVVQSLAAVGDGLRGRKVVVSLSSTLFVKSEDPQRRQAYAGNFSRLQARELVLSPVLGFAFKQRAARRMLSYSTTLERDPLLRLVSERLAEGSLASRVVYYVLLPMGRLQNLLLQLADQAQVAMFIRGHPDLNPEATHEEKYFDWPALRLQASQDYRRNSDNNPFGWSNGFWSTTHKDYSRERNTRTDQMFRQDMSRAEQWTDLELLLEELKAFGAKPLILSMPLHGRFSDFQGVTSAARRTFYERLRHAVQGYGVPVFDFADHDEDLDFLLNHEGHLSPVGWLYYDEVVDEFYHDRLQ